MNSGIWLWAFCWWGGKRSSNTCWLFAHNWMLEVTKATVRLLHPFMSWIRIFRYMTFSKANIPVTLFGVGARQVPRTHELILCNLSLSALCTLKEHRGGKKNPPKNSFSSRLLCCFTFWKEDLVAISYHSKSCFVSRNRFTKHLWLRDTGWILKMCRFKKKESSKIFKRTDKHSRHTN